MITVMKKILLLIFALALVCNTLSAQTTLPEAVAAGNKVFFQLVNDEEHPIPEDEIEDVTRELVAAGSWELVDSVEEADFILKVISKKKMVFNSPRTWLTPSVLDKEGNELWKGDTYKADATLFNGLKSTNTCIRTVIEKGFVKNLFKKAGRN